MTLAPHAPGSNQPVSPDAKPKLALYWCASCGGCEEAVVDLGPALLDVADAVDIVLWPVALDFKYADLDRFGDGEIAASLINGAIRTDEQDEIARLLRAKSQLVIAFGSCATSGGVPGLANLTSRDEIFRTSYRSSPTVDNPTGPVPHEQAVTDGYPAPLPRFWDRVRALDQVVEVDYYLPGCPPTPELIKGALDAILSGNLPPRGAWLAPDRSLCDSCPRGPTRDPDTRIEALHLPHEIETDPERCLLEQGLPCCGPATRGGCGALCIAANMPCTGCFGPPPGVRDQGAKMLSAVASLLAARSRREAEEMAAKILDPAGTFYRYAVPRSTLGGRLEQPDPEPSRSTGEPED